MNEQTHRDRIAQLEQQLKYANLVAAYFASCHAATLEGLPKRASKYQRTRHVDICEKAARYLKGDEIPPIFGRMEEQVPHAIERCEKAAARAKVL